jgi:hypothetical protein
MSLKRILAVRLPLAAGFATATGLLFSLGGVFDCSSYPTFKNLPPDCSLESEYELYDVANDVRNKDQDAGPRRDLTLDNPTKWFGAPDYTPEGGNPTNDPYLASMPTPAPEPIPNVSDAGLCSEYPKAMVFRASHNNDWGGLFGNWQFAQSWPNDASEWNGQQDYWEGIALWARAPGATVKSFTMALDDENTANAVVDTDSGIVTIPSNCRAYGTDAGTLAGGGPVGIDPATGTPLTGSGTSRSPYPDECGNSYSKVVTVTSDWDFYPIPFSEFKQDAKPNRLNAPYNPKLQTTLLTSALRGISLRMPREANVELWIAKMAFYHKKQ